MQIHLALTIDSNVINADAMEKIKTLLRREMLKHVFDAVDQVAEENDYRFGHRDISVDGVIKVVS